MASIGKDAFNIDGLTIYLALNILVQQSLSSSPNLSTHSSNRLKCQYERLQLVLINELSLVNARMLNDHK
jgi:hypothetical protein